MKLSSTPSLIGFQIKLDIKINNQLSVGPFPNQSQKLSINYISKERNLQLTSVTGEMSKIKENIEKMAGDGSQIDPTEVSTPPPALAAALRVDLSLDPTPPTEDLTVHATLDTENRQARGINESLTLTWIIV